MASLALAETPWREAPLLNFAGLAEAAVALDPYPHFIAHNVLAPSDFQALRDDFPALRQPGFFPLSLLARQGSFDRLMRELESPELAALLTEKLGIELRGKPRMITVRKWSAARDGKIHNDGEAKICTALLYLNPAWGSEGGGRLRVLRSPDHFEDMAAEIPPLYGTFFAFKRTESSWHGHKPFAGERRVVQVTWLRSHEDLARKEKRGRLSLRLKNLFQRNR